LAPAFDADLPEQAANKSILAAIIVPEIIFLLVFMFFTFASVGNTSSKHFFSRNDTLINFCLKPVCSNYRGLFQADKGRFHTLQYLIFSSALLEVDLNKARKFGKMLNNHSAKEPQAEHEKEDPRVLFS
jgi:hypothetical protein